jgi:hypothetical protein
MHLISYAHNSYGLYVLVWPLLPILLNNQRDAALNSRIYSSLIDKIDW